MITEQKTVEDKPITVAICKVCGRTVLTKAEELFCPVCRVHIIPEPDRCMYCNFHIKELTLAG